MNSVGWSAIGSTVSLSTSQSAMQRCLSAVRVYNHSSIAVFPPYAIAVVPGKLPLSDLLNRFRQYPTMACSLGFKYV